MGQFVIGEQFSESIFTYLNGSNSPLLILFNGRSNLLNLAEALCLIRHVFVPLTRVLTLGYKVYRIAVKSVHRDNISTPLFPNLGLHVVGWVRTGAKTLAAKSSKVVG